MRRLSGRRAARLEAGRYVIEGPKLVAEAVAAGVDLVAVFHDEEFDLPDVGEVEVHVVASGVLGRVVDAVTSQGVAAVATIPTATLDDVLALDGPVVVCDRVGDPGNVGTIARSLEAAGAAGLVLTAGSADPFGPKVVRASAGAVFRVPIVTDVGPVDLTEAAQRSGRRLLATTMAGGTPHSSADLGGPIAIVVGNESHGVAPEILAGSDELLTIEMDGPTESLNVAMATTVLVFEARRQRTAQ